MAKAPAEMMREFVRSQNFTSTDEVMTAMKDMFKNILQEVMECELAHELGYEKSERMSNDEGGKKSKNYRNGYSKKTVKTQMGELEIKVPRDRNGEYEPKIISKYNRNADGMEEKILSLYACGMNQRDISEQIKNLYDVEISPKLVSKISEKIMPDVKALVDSIVEELASDDRIKKLYDLWYEQKENTIRTYTDEMPDRIPLVQNKDFKSIRNAVIKEALKVNLTEDEAEEIKNTDEESVSNPFEYEENTSAESVFDSGIGVLFPRYSIKTNRNSVAVSSLYLLRYFCNMIQSRLRFEEKQKVQRTDKKLQQKINDKKQDQGLKM